MESALYFGVVRHRRFAPRPHRFAYPLFQLYADLSELDRLFAGSWLASTRRPAWAWLRRRDHFGDPDRPWAETVKSAVAAAIGRRPTGAVRLLSHPRTLGFRMNPVSFFYCFDADDGLDAVIAEVTNTPWDERHLYVIDGREASAKSERLGLPIQTRFAKQLHVSPFFPMDLDYRWRFGNPGEKLVVAMESRRGEERLFDATLRLERRALTPAHLRRALLGYPALTLKVFLWIYWQAARLRVRGAKFHPHPKRSPAARSEPPVGAASSTESRGGSSRAA